MSKTMLCVAVILFFINLSAQVQQDWAVVYSGISTDEVKAIAVDNSGNVYVTGRSIGAGSIVNPWDIVTIKYNSSGDVLWVKTFGVDNNREEANDIKVDILGNVYITGYIVNTTSLKTNYITIKYDANGDTVWTKEYNGLAANGGGVASSIALDNISGRVFVTGGSPGLGGYQDVDYATIAYGPDGSQLWVSRYDGPGNNNDQAFAIAINADAVFVTGSSRSTSSSTSADYLTIKYNSSTGDTVWIKRYNGPANSIDAANSIIVDVNGNVYITGSISNSNISDKDFATIKYSPMGNEEWVNIYSGLGNDEAKSIAVDESGNVYVAGASGGSNNDFLTVKYNASGVEQWVRRHNGINIMSYDIAVDLVVDNMSNVYVTGQSNLDDNNIDDCYTIKYNSNGDSIWAMSYNGLANHAGAVAIAIDTAGNVYVTGWERALDNSTDYVTIKYSQIATGISNNQSNRPAEFSLSWNYPNPFNPTTKIKYSIPSPVGSRHASTKLGNHASPSSSGNPTLTIQLKVYDVLGNEVATLVNEEKAPGIYEVEFDAKNLASGIYIYRLNAGENFMAKKMILLR